MTKNILPNLIIIGSCKAGTTSLHYYLNLHPEIQMSGIKELNYFIEEKNWNKGLEWYKSNFKGNAKIHGETSPHYTYYPVYKGVAQRMYSLIPNAKLIYIVRDPIERIVSHYLDEYKSMYVDCSIDEAVFLNKYENYLYFSKYYSQIEQYLKFFKRDQILIASSSNLKKRRLETLQRIFRFLEVDDTYENQSFLQLRHTNANKLRRKPLNKFVRYILNDKVKINKLKYVLPQRVRTKIASFLINRTGKVVDRPQMSKDTRGKVINILKDDIEKFKKIAECDLSNWSI